MSGGAYNKVYGWGSSISGGAHRTTLGVTNWAAGSLLEEF